MIRNPVIRNPGENERRLREESENERRLEEEFDGNEDPINRNLVLAERNLTKGYQMSGTPTNRRRKLWKRIIKFVEAESYCALFVRCGIRVGESCESGSRNKWPNNSRSSNWCDSQLC
jgi:hypothetical protein